MKRKAITMIATTVLAVFLLSGCEETIEDDISSGGSTGDASGGSTGTPSAAYPCLSGAWFRGVCSGNLNARVTFSGGDSGESTFADQDCNNVCFDYEGTYGRFFRFNYRVTSQNMMQIDYTSGGICGRDALPNGGSQSFSCNSDGTLTFGNVYQR